MLGSATVLVSILAGGLIAEAGLTLAGFSHPIFFRADRLTGTAHIPNVEGIYSAEGRAHVSINSDGWRDDEYSPAKPPEGYRIAVLGDSYASGFQVELDETFCEVMERDLAVDQPGVEVLDFGVSGYGTAQELLTLQHRVWKFEPDLVVLALFSGNDIASGSRAVYGMNQVPYFVLDGDKLVLDDSFLESEEFLRRENWTAQAFSYATQWSRLAQLLARIRFVLAQRNAVTTGGKDGATELGLYNRLYLPPEGPRDDWENAWLVNEAILRAMRDECRRQGKPFVVVHLSNPIQVHPNKAKRIALAQELEVEDLLYPDRRLQSFCGRESIPVLLLAPELQLWADEHKEYLHGFEGSLGVGHWNAVGHREAGRRIAAWLRSEIVEKDSSRIESTSSKFEPGGQVAASRRSRQRRRASGTSTHNASRE
jgi:hypothetical protein